ncbi:putative NCAIR mutase (PurE) family protein [Treponema sp. JC4]|uniref:nickel pincer cofactor biosynthesis protein LarB n=1 Tax=Treponema sp. JC4 TaxID=1124982 RepID=UPI00025B0AEE|nr:nickel pincer cofactor biosynthesis protein LarB [Treponema sp. JC4]EID84415.1 putative NCAIR mutase (PurE) family protein [Treponema sp. JC4]
MSDYEDLGFAKLDTDRLSRTGFSEVVFCQGKADDYLKAIFERLYKAHGQVLGTRATENQFEIAKSILPAQACVKYDKVARTIRAGKENEVLTGKIAVCTAGTADIPVAEEAAQCAEFWGSKVVRIYDVGVSGIHRLLSKTDELNSANVVIAIAGMEGALASVIGGLVKVPVIAVPTSVGYGANLGGLSALLTMINSCANGISVVNIDNGFGAAYTATQINRLAVFGGTK